MTAVAIILLAVSLIGLVALKWAEAERQRASLVAYRLRFPRDLEGELVERFLAGLSGLLLPRWRRWLSAPVVVLEVHAGPDGIEHFLLAPAAWSEVAENLLQSAVPGVRYEPTAVPPARLLVGAEYRLTSSMRPLRVDPAAVASQLLTSLQPLAEDEAVIVQWVVTPSAPVQPPRVTSGQDRQRLIPQRATVADGEAAAALRKKQAQPLLLASGRAGVAAASTARSLSLLRRVETAWHEGRAPGVHLKRRWLPARFAARRVGRRAAPFTSWPGLYNAEELAELIGWPIEVTSIPGLTLGGCRHLAATPAIARQGTVMAASTFPGDPRPLAVGLDARLRHLHVLGPTGTGKSTLLVNMAVQDLEAGHSVVMLDPKGDLIRDVTDRVPPARRGDVVILDPADEDRPVGLNPLRAGDGTSSEVVVENLVGLFKSLYRSSWGPRTDDVLRAALMTLAESGEATLCEVPLLLTNPAFRRRLVGGLDDPVGLESFWGWYEGLSDAERLAVVGPVLNKVRAFTMRPRVRAIIGQARPGLELREVLDNGGVLLVSLASGLLGEEAAALLGALVVAELWHATTARADRPADQRRPVVAYLDEWQHFLHLPTPMASVLAEARGLGLSMTLAHQHLEQVPAEPRSAVLSNARSRVVFQLPAADARLVARDLGGLLTPEELQGLGAFEVVCQLYAAGATQPPATGRTLPMVPATSDGADIRAQSANRYGMERGRVETEIRRRQAPGDVEAPVGRRRRNSGGVS